MSAPICEQCKKINKPGAKFCSQCRAPLPGTTSVQAASARKPFISNRAVCGCLSAFFFFAWLVGTLGKPVEPVNQAALQAARPIAPLPTTKPTPKETAQQKKVRVAAAKKEEEYRIQREQEEAEVAAAEQHARDNPLELVGNDFDWESGEYSNYIVGKIKNNTDHSYSYVQVTFALYDESGNQVGSTIDNVNGLEAGGTWRFKAIVTEEGRVSAKFLKVDGNE